jgi:hypothetical protein
MSLEIDRRPSPASSSRLDTLNVPPQLRALAWKVRLEGDLNLGQGILDSKLNGLTPVAAPKNVAESVEVRVSLTDITLTVCATSTGEDYLRVQDQFGNDDYYPMADVAAALRGRALSGLTGPRDEVLEDLTRRLNLSQRWEQVRDAPYATAGMTRLESLPSGVHEKELLLATTFDDPSWGRVQVEVKLLTDTQTGRRYIQSYFSPELNWPWTDTFAYAPTEPA